MKSNIIVENAKGEKEIVSVKNVKYLEADNRKMKVIIGDGKEHYIREKISDFENKIEEYEGFIRVGRSFIINVLHVERWEKKGRIVNGDYISISAKKYDAFENEIKRVMNI